jgi:hypothetical protein
MAIPSDNWHAVQQVNSPELHLQFELSGPLPIQAFGTIRNRDFYFHAKHSNWTFEMADDFGSLPSDTGNNQVFAIQGHCKFADEMSPDEARRIVTACARLYLEVIVEQL